jgi:hypothetical protein
MLSGRCMAADVLLCTVLCFDGRAMMMWHAYGVLCCVLQGKLLVCVNNKVMLYKMSTTADGRQELVSDCSPVGVQVLCLHLAVRCVEKSAACGPCDVGLCVVSCDSFLHSTAW